MESLRAISINVRGLKNKKKRHCIINFMKKEKYDIVAIQERHITTDEEAAQWELLWGGTLFYSSGTARSLSLIHI